MRILVLRPRGAGPHVAYSKDLSAGGIFVEGAGGEVGEETKVMIVEEESLFISKARVAHRRADGVGLEFLNPSRAFVSVVERILAALEA